MSDDAKVDRWRAYLSPLKMSLLAINAVCFGGCVVLLAWGNGSGPLVLLTVGTGLSFGAGLTGAIVAARRMASLVTPDTQIYKTLLKDIFERET